MLIIFTSIELSIKRCNSFKDIKINSIHYMRDDARDNQFNGYILLANI